MSIESLVTAIIAMVSNVPADRALAHAEAVQAAAIEHDVPVEILLSIAYIESRYDGRALSRKECATDDPESCTRKTGIWPKATKPPRARPSWFCGVMQTGGYVAWDECQRMREDVTYAYSVGAAHLQAWRNDKRCAALDDDLRLRCALAGYNGGNAALTNYKTSKYARWVLLQRDRIAKFAMHAAQKQPPES
jgi:hypothetical protein